MSALICAGTFSKDPMAWGFSPDTYIKAGRGPYILLNDDTWVLDLTSSLGQNLLGYGGDFADYVAQQVKQGIGFTLPHYLEHEAADRLADMLGNRVPGWSPNTIGVRFGKSGSDVTTAAVRLARAVTKKGWIFCFKNHYHGWGDTFIARTDPAWGLPNAFEISKGDEISRLEWAAVNDIDWQDFDFLSKDFAQNDIAAIIFEQPAFDPDPGWYPFLRKWCDDNGALLIADEVVTGLRYAPGGASEKYGIQPDLICMGKALGNGAAVSALIGRREYMEWFARTDPVFWSSTTNGNANDLAAANFVLTEWHDNGEKNVARLWTLGDKLIEGCREALQQIDGWTIEGHGARSVFGFPDLEEQAFFIHGMRRNGVLANRPNFPNLAMSGGQVNVMLAAVQDVVEERAGLSMAEVEKMVTGKLPRVLFKGR